MRRPVKMLGYGSPMGAADPNETPWALIQRLRAENQPEERIIESLRARGLSDADVELLGMRRTPEVTAPAASAPRSKGLQGALLGVLVGLGIDAASVLVLFGSDLLIAPLVVYGLALTAMAISGRPGERLVFAVVTTLIGSPGVALSLFALVASNLPHGVV